MLRTYSTIHRPVNVVLTELSVSGENKKWPVLRELEWTLGDDGYGSPSVGPGLVIIPDLHDFLTASSRFSAASPHLGLVNAASVS